MRNRPSVQAAIIVVFLFCVTSPQRLAAQCHSSAGCTCAKCLGIARSDRHGRWFVVDTANFQVCCDQSQKRAGEVAGHAENLRIELRTKWLGDKTPEVWNPRCQIVLHSSKQSYVSAVGRGSERTVGSSLVKIDARRTSRRQIDLLATDGEYLAAALPHELTHVVVRERFKLKPMPRWADEGIAILADPPAKQGRHLQDLKNAIAGGAEFHSADLLAMDEYPRSDRFGAFYGQSASLAQYLVDQKTPDQFVAFIEQANAEGYDSALQQCYGIAGVSGLHRQWWQHWNAVRFVSYDAE